jgi:hypothetical protein
MLGTCANCGAWTSRYFDADVRRPCNLCGSTRFWCVHVGMDGWPHFLHPKHEVLVDVTTGELLSADLCDEPPPGRPTMFQVIKKALGV